MNAREGLHLQVIGRDLNPHPAVAPLCLAIRPPMTSRGYTTKRDRRREFACALLCGCLKSDDCNPLGTKPDLERMRCAYVTET